MEIFSYLKKMENTYNLIYRTIQDLNILKFYNLSST